MKPEEQVIEMLRQQEPSLEVKKSAAGSGFYRFTTTEPPRELTLAVALPPQPTPQQIQMTADELLLAIRRSPETAAPVRRNFLPKKAKATP